MVSKHEPVEKAALWGGDLGMGAEKDLFTFFYLADV